MNHHPIWFLIEGVGLLAASTICLWATSSNFDDTEVKAVVGLMVSWLGLKGIEAKARQGKS